MPTTNFMLLDLPTVSVTLGPEWATQINEALETVDAHDHSSGKGTKITPSGLNINTSLDMQGERLIEAESVQLQNQTAALSGLSNIRSIYFVNGDLWATSGSGTAVQLTSGGSIISAPSAVTSVQSDALAGNLVISASDNFVLLRVDTSASRAITLPLASSVDAGRIYIVQDTTGTSESFPITITMSGADTIEGQSSLVLESNYSTTWFTGDGVSKWARS